MLDNCILYVGLAIVKQFIENNGVIEDWREWFQLGRKQIAKKTMVTW